MGNVRMSAQLQRRRRKEVTHKNCPTLNSRPLDPKKPLEPANGHAKQLRRQTRGSEALAENAFATVLVLDEEERTVDDVATTLSLLQGDGAGEGVLRPRGRRGGRRRLHAGTADGVGAVKHCEG